jgi:hypothetical protein
MTEPTPGPWIWGKNVSGEPTVRGSDPSADNGGFTVCQTFGPRKHANARLIATTPKLLEACRLFIAYDNAAFDYDNAAATYDKARAAARAAVFEATGEEP